MIKPILSICVSVHNTGKYLRRCLDSLINQTIENYEIILVNNGSTDDSLEIMQEYQGLNPALVRIFSQEDRGLAQGRQTGVDNAIGKYLGFVDADDFIEPDMYSTMVNIAEKEAVDIVECKAWHGERIIGQNRTGKFEAAGEFNRYLICGSPIPMLWSKIFKRELFSTAPTPLPKMYVNNEDVFAFPVTLLKARSIYYTDSVFYHYSVDNVDAVMNSLKNNPQLADKYFSNRLKTLKVFDHIKDAVSLCDEFAKYEKSLNIFKKNTVVAFLARTIPGVTYERKVDSLIESGLFSSMKEMNCFVRNTSSGNTKIDMCIHILGVEKTCAVLARKKEEK